MALKPEGRLGNCSSGRPIQHVQAHKKTKSEVEDKDPEWEVIQAGTGPHPDNENSPDHRVGPVSTALSQLRSSDLI